MHQIPFQTTELLAIRKTDTDSATFSWIQAKDSFVLLRGALLCLRGSRAKRRRTTNIHVIDLEIEKGLAGLSYYVALLTGWTSVQVYFNF